MIVCLGWGSLIWNLDGLEIVGPWEPNGPKVPVEYLRQSINGRLTLVIDKDKEVPACTVLWSRMQAKILAEAKENLRIREGKIKREYIGNWSYGDPSPEVIPGLAQWATTIQADAVIWTALPAKFNGENFRKPTYQEALEYLNGLPLDESTLAKEYVRRTPTQIRTPYREYFERDLGWEPEHVT